MISDLQRCVLAGVFLFGACSAVTGDGRIEISQDMIPFTLSVSGSYVVTEPLNGVSAAHGIYITADSVRLDLNGHTLSGVAGSLSGIVADPGLENLWIRNGTVTGWGSNGIQLVGTTNITVEHVSASYNGADGLIAGFGSSIRYCRAVGNGVLAAGLGDELGDGIEVENSSVVAYCFVADNDEHGIDAHSGSTVSYTTSLDNLHDGIHGSHNVIVLGCVTAGNSEGIEVASGALIEACVVAENLEDGIRVKGGGSRVVLTTAYTNGVSGTGNGIDIDDGVDIIDGASVVWVNAAQNTDHGINLRSKDAVYVRDCLAFANGGVFGGGSITNRGDGIRVKGRHARVERSHSVNNFSDGFDLKAAENVIMLENSSDDFGVADSNHYERIDAVSEMDQPWGNFELNF